MTVRILTGDCREVLRTLDADSVHCVVTSPPYFGLRDYGVAGQIGLEQSPDAYVAEMVVVFRELRRVLRPEGVAWLNLGDSYAAGDNGPGSGKQLTNVKAALPPKKAPSGAKPKDLLMIPARVALALQADGWWLRSDTIWHKPDPMPESVTDRPTSAHEHVFMLTKSARYFYDAAAVAEPASRAGQAPNGNKKVDASRNDVGRDTAIPVASYRNRRNVWTVPKGHYSGAHFAPMPPALAEICIKAGTSERGCCPACAAPWERVVHGIKYEPPIAAAGETKVYASRGDSPRKLNGNSKAWRQAAASRRTIGWRPTCTCSPADPVPCTVLDPFGGAGTTALVADRLLRHAVIIELNQEYATQARKRILGDAPLFAEAAE